ncbi:MAG TPA: hypothetical protein VFT64_11205 [Rickettsiales bacterium]|nr:hypothetical protein [Rickettsiales bacterium]
MKKLTASLVSAVVVLSSTAAFADTPVVREMNSFSHILEIANKSRAQAAAPSEFVIYHQEAGHKPCPEKHAKKGKKHHGKKEHAAEQHHGKKHHGHKHHHGKKAAAPAAEKTSK